MTDKVKNQSTLIYDTGADIVEVVFIELKKRNEIIKNKALKNLLDIICENKTPQNTFKNFFELSDEEVETMIESKSIVERIAEEAAEATIKATIEEATKEAQKQGLQQGIGEGIKKSFEILLDMGINSNDAINKLANKYKLSLKEIKEIISK